MQIESLRAFCLVVKHNSFAAAARSLKISTAKMTRIVQSIETELGLTLLHRSTRALTPTAAGQLFYQQSIELLQHFDASIVSLQTLSETVSGTLKIGIPASISHLWLTPNLHQFTKQYKELNVRIVIGNHLLDLLTERFDMIIHCGQLADSNLYYYPIRHWQKITCASPSYLKAHSKPITPSELCQHNCLDHYDNVNNTWRYKINNNIQDVYIDGNLKANSSLDLKTLAIAGHGIVYLPSFTISDALNNKQLSPLLEEYQTERYPMYAVFSEKKQNNKKIAAFIDFLESVLPE